LNSGLGASPGTSFFSFGLATRLGLSFLGVGSGAGGGGGAGFALHTF